MKKVFSLTLLALIALVVVSCGPTGNDVDTSTKIDLNVAINYQGRGITYQQDNAYTSFTGTQYNNGDLLPVWEALASDKYLNVTFNDVKRSDSTDNQLKAFEADNNAFANTDLINSTGTNFSKHGQTGQFIDFTDHLDKMPNLKAFLDENPSMKTSLTSADGGIYYTPYLDGLNEIESMFLVRIDWVQDLLDVATPAFDISTLITSMTVEKTLPETLNTTVTVANANGSTRNVTKERTQNILTILNNLPIKNGRTLGEAFVTYMKDVYGDQGYTRLSDVFVGTDAAYDVDELVALMYVVKANPLYLTREFTAPLSAVTVYFPRTSQNSRVRNYQRSAEMFGVRGMYSRYQFTYFGEDGNVKDARVEDAAMDAMNQLSAMYDDGLLPADINQGGNYDYRKNLMEGANGFMLYDFNASSTPQGYIDNALTKDPTYRFEAILPPVNNWLGGNEYFHFTEGVRALKNEAWGVPKHVENDSTKLARVLMLVDGMFDYSSNDSIGNVHLYGPAGYIDGTTTYNGETIPKISAAAMTEMQNLASGNMINYLRQYVGATMPIGHVRSLGLEYQTLSSQGIAGIERINTAVLAGTFRLAGVYESSNPWYQLSPSLFPTTTDENIAIEGITYSDYWADPNVVALVRLGFTGKETSSTKQEYINGKVIVNGVNTATAVYLKALNDAIARTR